MPHPLVDQLRFTRNEFLRALDGVSETDARHRLLPMNSISWIVGHLAYQEQRYWLDRAQGIVLIPDLEALVGWDAPASTPPLSAMRAAWHAITQAADPWLDALTTETLQTFMIVDGKPWEESIGSMLRRVTYHYWYHMGESQAIRQLLRHTDLPEFVGDIYTEGPYRPEHS